MASFSDEKMAEYKKAFQMFDKNGDGRISKTELKSVLKALGKKKDKKTVKQLMKGVDLNKDGKIDLEEFAAFMSEHFQQPEHQDDHPEALDQKTLDTFQVFDKNGDGFIDLQEILQVMKNIDLNVTEDEAKSMIAIADVNGDGRLDMTEFKKFISQLDPGAEKENVTRL